MSNSTFMPEAVIRGIDDIVATIAAIDNKAARNVLIAGLRGAMKPIAKRMRSDLSPKVKAARRWVGYKVYRKRMLTAKVGFGVGRKLADMEKIVPKNRPKSRPGVGISAVNVHWWISGTEQRYRKGSGRPTVDPVTKRYVRARGATTGAMPAKQPGLAAKAATAVQAETMRSAEVAAKKQLQKELKRLAKRNR